ncbi:MAG: undecaprenyldiphospho-muramoylpentapeptide beta-N-acetylglucosaminyltransferase [Actinomycetota bacterium]|nr:undecaprenyldiphospho-muramoylpentapeptide beta-N-acetylglucosaminyltransferase [Actinomycetota bacterium]
MLITGGGTAGHVYPGLAAAKKLKEMDPEAQIYFIGGRKGPEAELTSRAELVFFPLKVTSFNRRPSLKNLKSAYNLFISVIDSMRLIIKIKPDVVLGTGGYVSFPAIFAAVILGRPVILHEQNSVLGRANRLLLRFAKIILISFPKTEGASLGRALVTGNPVREAISLSSDLNKGAIYEQYGLSPKKKTLLIFGGSQGAKRINEAVLLALKEFSSLDGFQLVHLTGKASFEEISQAYELALKEVDGLQYRLFPYSDEIEKLYAIADLVVCRAGATTIAELMAVGLPSILVPYPFAVMDHQLANARFLESGGAARVIMDSDLTGSSLFKAVNELIFNKRALSEMGQRAAFLAISDADKKIADLMLEFGGSNSKVR